MCVSICGRPIEIISSRFLINFFFDFWSIGAHELVVCAIIYIARARVYSQCSTRIMCRIAFCEWQRQAKREVKKSTDRTWRRRAKLNRNKKKKWRNIYTANYLFSVKGKHDPISYTTTTITKKKQDRRKKRLLNVK